MRLALIALPWLALAIPAPTLLVATLAGLVVAAGAAHGFGAVLAFAIDRTARPMVDAAIAGAAIVVVLGGDLIGHFPQAVQLSLLVVGLALHTVAIALQPLRIQLRTPDAMTALLWVTLLAIVALHVVGLLASQHAAPYDDDGHWYAAVKRLRDTGGWVDPIGYPGNFQLGGGLAASAFAATISNVACTRVCEALGFVLAFAGLARFALVRGERRGTGALVFLLLALTISSKAQAEFDATLFWLPMALFVGVFRALVDRARQPSRGDTIWLGVLLAALIAIRVEYAPFALALLVVDRRAIALAFALVLPMLIGWHHRHCVPIAIALVVGLLPWRPRSAIGAFSWGIAITAALGWMSGDFGGRVTWVPIFAALYVSLAALAQAQWAPRAFLDELRYGGRRVRFRVATSGIFVLAMIAFIMRAQDPTVRMSWRTRFRMWVQDAAEIAHADPRATMAAGYREPLARLPAGAGVLTWVDHPERLDYASRPLFDLRVPRQKALRAFSWGGEHSPIPALANLTGARYLLVEPDLYFHQRAKDSLAYAFWCTAKNESADPVIARPAICADPLEQALVTHRVVDTWRGAVLVDLTQSR